MRFGDGSGISWTTCKQSARRSRQTTTPTSHHSSFAFSALRHCWLGVRKSIRPVKDWVVSIPQRYRVCLLIYCEGWHAVSKYYEHDVHRQCWACCLLRRHREYTEHRINTTPYRQILRSFDPCAPAMRPYAKLLWALVIYIQFYFAIFMVAENKINTTNRK